MKKVAVIGIGSNSVRMLVAVLEEDGFTRLTRDRARRGEGKEPGGRTRLVLQGTACGGPASRPEPTRPAFSDPTQLMPHLPRGGVLQIPHAHADYRLKPHAVHTKARPAA